MASNEKEACSSSDFERSVVCRCCKKQAGAVITSVQRPKSKLEQLFRAPSGYGARSSSDFERSVEEAAPVRCFRVRPFEVFQSRPQRRTYILRIYIYWVRIWRLTAPVKSHKAQLEARHRSKQSDFAMNFEGKRSIVESAFEGKRSIVESTFEGKRSMLEQ